MIKRVISIFTGLLIAGFISGVELSASMKMFQSVSEKEAVLVQKGKEKRYCTRCGMDLVMFYKTSHAAKHGDTDFQYCSIHCFAEHLDSGTSLDDIKVVDTASLKLIDAKKAYYVVGSQVRGTMSRVSKYAFLNENDAKEFQAKNGGKIMDFSHTLEKAKEDFK